MDDPVAGIMGKPLENKQFYKNPFKSEVGKFLEGISDFMWSISHRSSVSEIFDIASTIADNISDAMDIHGSDNFIYEYDINKNSIQELDELLDKYLNDVNRADVTGNKRKRLQ